MSCAVRLVVCTIVVAASAARPGFSHGGSYGPASPSGRPSDQSDACRYGRARPTPTTGGGCDVAILPGNPPGVRRVARGPDARRFQNPPAVGRRKTRPFDFDAWRAARRDDFLVRPPVETTSDATTPAMDVVALLSVAARDASHEVRAAALVALGKVAAPWRDDVAAILLERLCLAGSAPERAEEAEAAAIGLGLLGRAASVAPLLAIAKGEAPTDSRESTPPSPVLRGCAAVAIGLIGRYDRSHLSDGTIEDLLRLLEGGRRSADLATGAALAFSLARFEAAAPALRRVVADDARSPEVRAAAAAALAEIEGERSVPFLLERCLSAAPSEVRRAAVAALGRRAPRESKPVSDALVEVATNDLDGAVRDAAILALGEQGSEDGGDFLFSLFARGSRNERIVAATALGVHGVRGGGSKKRAVAAILAVGGFVDDVDEKVAYAAAFGVLDTDVSFDALARDLERGNGSIFPVDALCDALATMSPRALSDDAERLLFERLPRLDGERLFSAASLLARNRASDVPRYFADFFAWDGIERRRAAAAAATLFRAAAPNERRRVVEALARRKPPILGSSRAAAAVLFGVFAARDPSVRRIGLTSILYDLPSTDLASALLRLD